jgi:hypothetical protein
MISSAIKKRTQAVNKKIKEEWCEKWMKYIEQHPEHPWNWYGISNNPNLTMEYVEKHPEHSWNWYWISSNAKRIWFITGSRSSSYRRRRH